MTTSTILLAVTDPMLHPEAHSVAAATGMDIIDTTDPREITRHVSKATAVLVDATTARHAGNHRRHGAMFVLEYEPNPIDWKLVVHVGADDGFVLPAQGAELLHALGLSDGTHTERTHAPVIAVTGAVGGAGTSTVAASVATRWHQHHPTVLIDADPLSGGIDLLVGCETARGVRWSDVNIHQGTINAADLAAALPTTHTGIMVLTVSRAGTISAIDEDKLVHVLSTLNTTCTIVIDIPTHAPYFYAVADMCDLVAMVVPAEVRAAAAAQKTSRKLQAHRVPLVGIARYRGWSGLSVSDIETIADLTVCAEVPTVSALPRQLETVGLRTLPKALAKAADHTISAVPAGAPDAIRTETRVVV